MRGTGKARYPARNYVDWKRPKSAGKFSIKFPPIQPGTVDIFLSSADALGEARKLECKVSTNSQIHRGNQDLQQVQPLFEPKISFHYETTCCRKPLS